MMSAKRNASLSLWLSGALLLAFSTQSVARLEDILAPGGVWWHPKSRLTLGKKVSLTAPTQWEAEEIFINAPIVTNGQPLLIETRKLVFRKRRKDYRL